MYRADTWAYSMSSVNPFFCGAPLAAKEGGPDLIPYTLNLKWFMQVIQSGVY